MRILIILVAILLFVQPALSVMITGRVETRIGHTRHLYKLKAKHRKRRPIVLKQQYAKLETRTAYELQAIQEHWHGWIGISYQFGVGTILCIYECSNLSKLGVQVGDCILSEDGYSFTKFYGPNPDWIAGQKVRLKIRKRNGRIVYVTVALAKY